MTWGSKAGVTFLTPQIEEFVKNNPQYNIFAKNFMAMGLTPIFEWCSRQNRIVIDYPVDRLVLLAMRSNLTGEYLTYSALKNFKDIYNLYLVKEFEGNVRNMQHLSDSVKGMSGIEGFVIRQGDLWAKIKCDEYCMFHKAKDDINFEKNIISIIVNSQADDFKNLLSEQDKINFQKFEKDFWNGINSIAYDINLIF